MGRLKHTFRSRLFIGMLIAALIPLLICTILTIRITRLQLVAHTADTAAQQTDVLMQSMDLISTALAESAENLRGHKAVLQEMTSNDDNQLSMNSLLFDATNTYRNFAVFDLYDESGEFCASTQGSSAGDLSIHWGVLYGAASKPGQAVFYASEDPTESTAALLLGAVKLDDIGYLVLRVYLSGFHQLMDGKYPQSDILVLSRFFRPIYSSQSYMNTSLAPVLRQQLLDGQRLDDDHYIYTVRQHEPTGLFLVLRQPQTFTARTLHLLYSAGIICALVCVVISIASSLLISHQISYPLVQLSHGLDQVQQDNLETQINVPNEDELGQLAQRFNQTVAALKANREELLHNQQELNEAQIRMLQAQLNPHFLCNTLDTMKWISKINKVPQVALMSTNLADILRFCISAEEFVPLYREMETLERYIEIQKIRLSDDFAFEVAIPEELYDCMVPKMILQPIVENAILHGLNDVAGSTIRVSAIEIAGKILHITVTDNGKGFPPEMVGNPYRRDKDLAKGHLGLYNVDTILRRNYGDEFGLYLNRGANGIGASVTAALPIHYEEETEC